MTATTLGQAAAVAFHTGGGSVQDRWERAGQAAIDAERTATRDRLAGRITKLAAQPQTERVPELGAVAYEAAENAPLRARVTDLEQQLAELRESLTNLAGEWDRDAADDDAEAERPNRPRVVLEATARTTRAAAAELRKRAGLEDS